MADEYILRYFPHSICPEGFGRKGRKGIRDVTLERLEEVARSLERERFYDDKEELGDIIRYTFKKGEEVNCGELNNNNDLFILSADVYIEVGIMKEVPYGDVEYKTGHVNTGVREARIIKSLRSLSLPSLVNTAVFRLGLSVNPQGVDLVEREYYSKS